ncbi:glycoside hydrolase domain-containing protein [Christiangramia fulva]
MYAPEIKDFQPAKQFKIGETISVSPRKGWLLIIDSKG